MGRRGASALLILFGCCFTFSEVAGFFPPFFPEGPVRHCLVREASHQDPRGNQNGPEPGWQRGPRQGWDGAPQRPPANRRRHPPGMPVPEGGETRGPSSMQRGGGGGRRRQEQGDWGEGGQGPTNAYRIKGLLFTNQDSTEGLLRVVEQYVQHFERNHCAMALNRLSKAAVREGCRREVIADPRMRLLLDRTTMLMHTFNCIELANVINGLSKLNYPVEPAFLQSFTETTAAYFGRLGSQELSNIVNGFANLGHDPGPAFMDGFMQNADEKMEEFKVQELAILINGITRLNYTPPPSFLEHFTAVFRSLMGQAACQNLANVANSFGRLDYSPPGDFWPAFSATIQPILPDFKPQELSNTIHALGRLNVTVEPELYRDLEHNAFLQLERFNIQELTIAFIGLIKMGMEENEAFLSRLSKASIRHFPRANEQDISLLVSALGRFKFDPGAEWFSAIMARLKITLPHLNPITIGHTIRFIATYASTARIPPALLDAVSARIEEIYRDPTARPAAASSSRPSSSSSSNFGEGEDPMAVSVLVRLAGSFASLEYIAGPNFNNVLRSLDLDVLSELRPNEIGALLHYMCRTASSDTMPTSSRLADMAQVRMIVMNHTWHHLPEFSPPHLSSVLTSISRIGWNVPVPFLDSARDVALANFTEFDTQEIINILSAYTRLNYYPSEELVRQSVLSLGASMARLTLQGLSNVINAYAKLGHDPAVYLPSFWARAELLLTHFGHRLGLGLLEAAMMLWSLAVLDSPHTTSITRLLVTLAIDQVEKGEHNQIERILDCHSQLKQAQLYAQLLRPDVLPPPMLSAFTRAVDIVGHATRHVVRGDTTVSGLQRDVATAMVALGMDFEEEVDDGVFFYDMLVQPRDPAGRLPVVVEVDGSPHFFVNVKNRALRDTEFKRRIVRAQTGTFAGLVSVPFFKWRTNLPRPVVLSNAFEVAGLNLRDYIAPEYVALLPPPGFRGRRKAGAEEEASDVEEEGEEDLAMEEMDAEEEMAHRLGLKPEKQQKQQHDEAVEPRQVRRRRFPTDGEEQPAAMYVTSAATVSDVRMVTVPRPTATKKPRASARKAAVEEDQEETAAVAAPAPEKKPRGRRKAAKEEEEVAAIAAPAPEKKPRGRPRKAAAAAPVVVVESVGGDATGEEVVVKRPRGRPRKKPVE